MQVRIVPCWFDGGLEGADDVGVAQKMPIIGERYVREIPPSDNVRFPSTGGRIELTLDIRSPFRPSKEECGARVPRLWTRMKPCTVSRQFTAIDYLSAASKSCFCHIVTKSPDSYPYAIMYGIEG